VAASAARAVRTGPTGLDVTDPNQPGKTYRPTSPAGWEIISNTLKEKKVKFISAQEVKFAAERGIPIIDVRPKSEYAKGHIKGAANVQYYRLIEGWSAWKTLRRIGFTFFGVVGTEPNTDFLNQAAAVVPDASQGAVLVCNLGGNLDPDYGPSPYGYQTRSLMAAYELYEAGFDNLQVLKDGMGGWTRQERAVVEGELPE